MDGTEPCRTPTLQKAALRRSLLQTRQALSLKAWQDKSAQLCHHLQTCPLVVQSQTILAYFSIRQEPDLSSLLLLPYQWGFPRCVGKTLSWHRWSSTDSLPLQTGKYNIPEPHPQAPLLEPQDVDLILVPSVACDHRGYRLGYGGGFYDRLLADPRWATKPTIGIVFEFAYLPELPVEAWDRPLNAVCTETGLYSPSSNTGHSAAESCRY